MALLHRKMVGGIAVVFCLLFAQAEAHEIKGSVLDATPGNLEKTWKAAHFVLPAALTGGQRQEGLVPDMPALDGKHVPVVVIMHGSSGVAGFIKEYQNWLADDLGLVSIAPDSLAIPDRLTYTSPIAKEVYERLHALRLAELENALAKVQGYPWVDRNRIVVIGTSEGSVPVARLPGTLPVGRVMYSWSCETNYFVDQPKIEIPPETPVLSVIASRDPYFSPDSPLNKDMTVKGTCADALKNYKDATITILSTDKHTIMNFPQARDITAAFLRRILKN